MADRDLYSKLKGTRKEISDVDFKESIFALVHKTLKIGNLTGEQKAKVARLRAYIEIHFKDF